MTIKDQSAADAVAAFLARGGKVTKCAPHAADAIPLRKLRKQAETAATHGHRSVLARRGSEVYSPAAERMAYQAAEHRAEQQMEQAAAMGGRCCGFDEWGDAVGYGDDYGDDY